MEVHVYTLPEFNVIGISGQGPVKFATWWVRPLWRRFYDEFDSIRHLVKHDSFGELSGIWGLMSDASVYLRPWREEGRYMAGCEAAVGASPPQGFSIWNIPSFTYLVVSCTRDNYAAVYRDIMSQIIKSNHYRLIGSMQERYPSSSQLGTMRLYFPVQRISETERGLPERAMS